MASEAQLHAVDATASSSTYAGMEFTTIVASPWRRLGCVWSAGASGAFAGWVVGMAVGVSGSFNSGRGTSGDAVAAGGIGAVVGAVIGVFTAQLWYESRSHNFTDGSRTGMTMGAGPPNYFLEDSPEAWARFCCAGR